MKKIFLLATLGLSLFAFGCAGGQPMTKAEIAKGSILMMYLDTDEMDGDLEWISLKQSKAGEAPSYWRFGIYEDYAWRLGLPNAGYQISSYGGMDGFKVGCFKMCAGTQYTYQFPTQGNGFYVKEQGVYFLGSFKHVKTGTFFNRKFDLKKIKEPTERQVTEMVLERVRKEAKGDDSFSPAVKMLEAHLRSLK